MTSEEVRELVEREIGGNWELTNAHGCDLRRCPVPPVLVEYDSALRHPPIAAAEVVRLWLVLEELPGERDCYKIVFSEQTGLFGLAIGGTDRDVFIGFYGNFLETYAAM